MTGSSELSLLYTNAITIVINTYSKKIYGSISITICHSTQNIGEVPELPISNLQTKPTRSLTIPSRLQSHSTTYS